jgi:hypothetical protein
VSKVYHLLDIRISNNFMKFSDKKKSNLIIVTILVAGITIGGLLFVPFLQLQQLMMTRMRAINYDNSGYHDTDNNNNNYYYHIAFAYHGKEISEKLNSAHFLPLTSSNNQSHQVNQVKVVVNYTVLDPSSVSKQNMTALMRVYASNGTLIRSSPAELGYIGNKTNNTTTSGGQTTLATAITDSKVRDVRAFVFFTNTERNGNFSSPLNVNLTLGQRIPK